MECLRCGVVIGNVTECPQCGVVLAKARPLPPRDPARAQCAPETDESTHAPGGSRWLSTLAMLGLGLAGVLLTVRQFREPATIPAPSAAPATSSSAAEAPSDRLVELPAPDRPLPLPLDPGTFTSATEGDAALASALADRVRTGRVSPQDVQTAETLYARNGEGARMLLVSTLLAAGRLEGAAGRYDEALRLVERAEALQPGLAPVTWQLLSFRERLSDWPGVERAATELLRRTPGDSQAVQALAYALIRQDRSPEARVLLQAHLEKQRDPAAAALLARMGQDDATEQGLRQQNLSHFHLRYDGEAHEDVGREVLNVLERHYATLTTAFGSHPAETIPVVLLSRQAYYGAGDAPAWAGGHYSTFDGRVRIPIGGLTTSLTPQLDNTVLHELTHAFVADLSAGRAPRELHEGLAQWMEGDRTNEEAMKALLAGRLPEVHAFYLASLALVEDLMNERGQASINELLGDMARTRDADRAFRSVYGSDYRALLDAAQERWRRRYGG